ncbi:VOC family protein [Acinetobacter guillouiae]|uniref:VOC family protein n=1 Tax=Acinetobacter TaxID=469 RepID=UPI000CFF665F|nr:MULTISPECIES: VOC family protein [Acinetobacter]MCS4296725.1 putative glyoxalase superfamily protein PhnB [Acinetobacter guillouiae]MCW2250847.1 putative glyoxalase superfamily protein PhnB [Acinetobacter sp. BIGb0204]NII37055.1 putative glyoxalase superfamily protein PhnB [Acinetobacter sp. BIGb0196]QLD60274.1 bleomycin resistance family protein [Acinetobacter sp. MYb10]
MKICKISPNFEVTDIKKTTAFYTENLGFNLIMAVPESQDGIDQTFLENKEYVYALVQRDNVEFMFQRSDTFKNDVVFSKGLAIGATVSFYMEIEGINEFYLALKHKNLQLTELKTTWYGMQEFYLKDLNGYILGFAEKVG